MGASLPNFEELQMKKAILSVAILLVSTRAFAGRTILSCADVSDDEQQVDIIENQNGTMVAVITGDFQGSPGFQVGKYVVVKTPPTVFGSRTEYVGEGFYLELPGNGKPDHVSSKELTANVKCR